MVLELGPCPAAEAESWTRFARRLIIELRSDPEAMDQVSPDVIDLWSSYIEQWSARAVEAGAAGEPFRWSEPMEPDVGEFLLHGLDRCLHSTFLRRAATEAEAEAHRGFTMGVVRAFVDGLTTEGTSYCHYVDQVMLSFGAELES